MKDDKNLIDQAKQGVEGAFSELFSLYYNSVKYTIYNMVRNKDITDDLLSVTFTKAFKKISTYANPISFEMWLKTIAINTAIDYIRKMKNEKQNNYIDDDSSDVIELRGTAPSAEEILTKKEEYKQLMEAMAMLRSNYRRILQLRYLDDLSYKTIATTLNLPEVTVKSQLYKAKQKLKKQLEKISKNN